MTLALPKRCSLCDRPIGAISGRRKYCRRACAARAQHLKHRGKPPRHPGYQPPRTRTHVTVPSALAWARGGLARALKLERWDEAHAYEDVVEALERVKAARKHGPT